MVKKYKIKGNIIKVGKGEPESYKEHPDPEFQEIDREIDELIKRAYAPISSCSSADASRSEIKEA